MPLEPFNRKENLITIIRENSRAIDAFNYEQFGYQYDNLNFHGLTIPELEAVLEARRQEDRVFANFMLHVSDVSLILPPVCRRWFPVGDFPPQVGRLVDDDTMKEFYCCPKYLELLCRSGKKFFW